MTGRPGEGSVTSARCQPGARQLHLASGEIWTLVRRLSSGRLLISTLDGEMREAVTVEQWTGQAWVAASEGSDR